VKANNEVDDKRIPGPVAARILRTLSSEDRELYGAEIIKSDPSINERTFYAGYDDLVAWGWINFRSQDESEREKGQRGAPRIYLKITEGGRRALMRYDYIHLGIPPSLPSPESPLPDQDPSPAS
jgi:DNA-binding PadR family transcriptional regulator